MLEDKNFILEKPVAPLKLAEPFPEFDAITGKQIYREPVEVYSGFLTTGFPKKLHNVKIKMLDKYVIASTLYKDYNKNLSDIPLCFVHDNEVTVNTKYLQYCDDCLRILSNRPEVWVRLKDCQVIEIHKKLDNFYKKEFINNYIIKMGEYYDKYAVEICANRLEYYLK